METSAILVISLLETVDQGIFTDPFRNEGSGTKGESQSGRCSVLADENFPRGQWPLAQVIEVFRGGGGLVRSARVKTSCTVMTYAKRQRQREVKTTVKALIRPITKLCRLELSSP